MILSLKTGSVDTWVGLTGRPAVKNIGCLSLMGWQFTGYDHRLKWDIVFVLKNVWLIHFSSKAELEELLCQIKSIHIFKGSTVRFCSVCVWGTNQTFLLEKSVVEANFFFHWWCISRECSLLLCLHLSSVNLILLRLSLSHSLSVVCLSQFHLMVSWLTCRWGGDLHV